MVEAVMKKFGFEKTHNTLLGKKEEDLDEARDTLPDKRMELHREWRLLFLKDAFPREEGTYTARIKAWERPLSLLERRWLSAVLSDPKVGLFMDDTDISGTLVKLGNVKPLYESGDFYAINCAGGADDFASPEYRRVFRAVLSAIREKKEILLHISGEHENGGYVIFPVEMEYSMRGNKFRVVGVSCDPRQNPVRVVRVAFELSRVKDVEIQDVRTIPADGLPDRESDMKTAVLYLDKDDKNLEEIAFAFSDRKFSGTREGAKVRLEVSYAAEEKDEIHEKIALFGN
jgi:hypothetical protein